MTNPAWKTMPAAKACDILNFWASAPWPMSMDETHRYAAQLGWTIEEEDGEDFLVDNTGGFTMTDVSTSVMPSGDMALVSFYLADVIRDITSEATAFLDDHFTLYYREMAARWGVGTQSTLRSGGRIAKWELGADKGRITLLRNAKSITANFDTPQYAKVLRDLGE